MIKLMDMVQAPAKGFVEVTASENPLPNNWNYFYSTGTLTVTVVDQYDHTEEGVVLIPGYHFVAWRKVTTISGEGKLYRVHNNDKDPEQFG